MTVIQRAAVSVEEAGVRLGVSRSMVWKLVNSGTLRSVRAGKRRLVPISAINEFLGDGEGSADDKTD